jgi:hypothetical protein
VLVGEQPVSRQGAPEEVAGGARIAVDDERVASIG